MSNPTNEPYHPTNDAPPTYDQSLEKNVQLAGRPPMPTENVGMQGQPYVYDASKPVQPAPIQDYQPQQQFNTQYGFENQNYVASNAQPIGNQRQQNDVEVGFTVRQTFSDLDVRRLFVRKVFVTLGLQLLVTFGFVCIFYFVQPVQEFVQRNSAVYYAAYGIFFVFYFILVCSSSAARNHPYNIIMLVLLTLALSYMVGTIATFYTLESVVIGLGMTVVVCVSVILFSIQTKYDFTKCAGLLFILVMVLFWFGFITIFTYWRSWYLQVVYGALGALVFTLFLAFDVQLVMGGRKYELDPEEYIFASLILYIDIIYIFLFLLQIFGRGK